MKKTARYLNNNRPQQTLLRLPRVIKITGLSKSKIYALIKTEKFPRPIKIGARISIWPKSEIAAWINQHILAARHHKIPSAGKNTCRVESKTRGTK